jgi:uncharacterized protein YifN (PemK superfamily)
VAIGFFPKAGQGFMCDFSGFKKSEMVKPRPVVVISPRLHYRSEIVSADLSRPGENVAIALRAKSGDVSGSFAT